MQSTDDAFGAGVDITKRVADGDDRFTDHQIVTVSTRNGRERALATQFHQRQIALWIRCDQVRSGGFAVVQRHVQFVDVFDHVVVRDHITARIDDDPRSHPVDLTERIRCSTGHAGRGGSDRLLTVQVHHRW